MCDEGEKPEGSRLKNVAKSLTPTAVMTQHGIQYAKPVPDAGRRRQWEVQWVNGRDFLYPESNLQAERLGGGGGLRSAALVSRPSIQQIASSAKGDDIMREVSVKLVQRDSLRPGRRNLLMRPEDHAYRPPADNLWGTSTKMTSGRKFKELDMLHKLHELNVGGMPVCSSCV